MQNLDSLACFVLLFAAAGICEMGGGWLVWKGLRDLDFDRPERAEVVGAAITLVGVVAIK